MPYRPAPNRCTRGFQASGQRVPPRCGSSEVRIDAPERHSRGSSRPELNRPGFQEAIWFGSRCQGEILGLSVVTRFGVGRWHVANRLEKTMIEPVDPLDRGEPDSLEGPLRPAPMDHLGFKSSLMVSARALSITVADGATAIPSRRAVANGTA